MSWAFAAVLCLSIFAANRFYYHKYTSKVIKTLPYPLSEMPRSWVDLAVRNADDAKKNFVFWTIRYDTSQDSDFAVKLLQNPELFRQAFPGYDRARINYLLWRRYFSRTFDEAIWLPALGAQDRRVAVYTSWLGCLDVIEKYGADAMVVGTSEVYRDVVISQLFDDTSKKALACASGAMMPSHLREMSQILVDRHTRIPVIVWGYSHWFAYTRSPELTKMNANKIDILENFKASSIELKLSHFFPPVSWDKLFKLNRQKIAERPFSTDSGEPVAADDGKSKLETIFFPTKSLGQKGALEKRATQSISRVSYHMTEGISERDCDMTEASRDLDKTLEILLKAADKVVIYVPPTTPLHVNGVPSCYLENVRGLLQSKKSDRVFVITDDWKSYGLEYSDYVYRTLNQGISRIDINHTNYNGAVKVTKRLNQFLRKL